MTLQKINRIPWEELGQAYRQKFLAQADFLIEKEYVTDMSIDKVAEKLYYDFLNEKEKQLENPTLNDSTIIYSSKWSPNHQNSDNH